MEKEELKPQSLYFAAPRRSLQRQRAPPRRQGEFDEEKGAINSIAFATATLACDLQSFVVIGCGRLGCSSRFRKA